MRAARLLGTSHRLLPRAASLAAAAASASASAAILCEPAPPPKSAAPARLRRQSTLGSYVAGQAIEVLYVPQVVGPGVDVGHVVLVVENLDGTHGTLGFYPSSLTLGLRSVAGEEAVVVTPDPLYAKALTSRDGRLAAKVQPLYRGVLSAEQAAKLNAWSDALVLTTRVGRTGELRERGTATLSDLRYQPLGVSGTNCVTFLQQHFGLAIECPAGLPRLCKSMLAEAGCEPDAAR